MTKHEYLNEFETLVSESGFSERRSRDFVDLGQKVMAAEIPFFWEQFDLKKSFLLMTEDYSDSQGDYPNCQNPIPAILITWMMGGYKFPVGAREIAMCVECDEESIQDYLDRWELPEWAELGAIHYYLPDQFSPLVLPLTVVVVGSYLGEEVFEHAKITPSQNKSD